MKTSIAVLLSMMVLTSNAIAAGSPSYKPSVSKDVKYYNEGVRLMYDKKFPKAEDRFRKALEKNDRFAEAHNNLAYTLRKQGPEHYDEALKHYNRAIDLKPGMPEPYMYRGVLHMQMGSRTLALQDHEKLVSMGSNLAEELEYVVNNGREKEPEQFFGVSSAMKK